MGENRILHCYSTEDEIFSFPERRYLYAARGISGSFVPLHNHKFMKSFVWNASGLSFLSRGKNTVCSKAT